MTYILLAFFLISPISAQEVEPSEVPETSFTEAMEAGSPAVPADPEAETADAEDSKNQEPRQLQEPIQLEDVVETSSALRDAIESRQWPLVIGLLLTGVVYILRRAGIESIVSSKALPWLTLSLATSSQIGISLSSGIAWQDAIWTAIYTAGSAIMAWDLSGLFRGETSEESEELE